MVDRFSAKPFLDGLTTFQRRTVDHVFEQFHVLGSRHFLVADETGLGKSMVARGLVARTIEQLQDQSDIRRIDIVYVCSNAELGRQNLRRLNVTGEPENAMASRLTLLALKGHHLSNPRATANGKGINLVSLTPGTSFETGSRDGTAEERALLCALIKRTTSLSPQQESSLDLLMQGRVQKQDSFQSWVRWVDYQLEEQGVDEAILEKFHSEIVSTHLPGLLNMIGEAEGCSVRPDHLREPMIGLTGDLRSALAKAGVEALEPDLVILDEFQKFTHLLEQNTDAGELAQQLFLHDDARVLLLSATPYKSFTYAEELEDAHEKDLFRTLEFLANGNSTADLNLVRTLLRRYRDAVQHGQPMVETQAQLEAELLKLMSRSERPSVDSDARAREQVTVADRVEPEDLIGFVALQDLAATVAKERDHSLATTNYWKSAPYFATFCDGYRIRDRIRENSEKPEVIQALAKTQHISARDLKAFRRIDAGNARLRSLMADSVDRGWWRLLWIPPSLPYEKPAGPFAQASAMTKRLVFSSWMATPTAVASLLSYDVERRIAAGSGYTENTPEGRKRITKPLTYSVRGNRPADMSTLLAFWPSPELARLGDPLIHVRANDGKALNSKSLKAAVRSAIAATYGEADDPAGPDNTWRAAFSRASSWGKDPDVSAKRVRDVLESEGRGGEDHEEHATSEMTGLARHLRLARETLAEGQVLPDHKALDILAEVALHGPGCIALRVVDRLVGNDELVSELDRMGAAAVLANGVRSMFNRHDASLILAGLFRDRKARRRNQSSQHAWRRVLVYIGMGNLEAVLDEWLFQKSSQEPGPLTSEGLMRLCQEAAKSLAFRPATYHALDADNPSESLSFGSRFAVRYQSRREDIGGQARLGEIREAFNSPFWPFVLATTSVGQEGIDFHWWCHAVLHWNIPANPVDFEQREGRVDRYRGHAIRKNIAARHGEAALAAGGHPWTAAYELATDLQHKYGDFSPNWVYPGEARVERHVFPYVLSSDNSRYEQMKKAVALYRLTFGQPRQEDMLELLQQRFSDSPVELIDILRLDLTPEPS